LTMSLLVASSVDCNAARSERADEPRSESHQKRGAQVSARTTQARCTTALGATDDETISVHRRIGSENMRWTCSQHRA